MMMVQQIALIMKPTHSETNAQLVEKIKASSLYRSYGKAFQAVTGLPLVMQPAQGSGELVLNEGPQNRFCQLLNKGRTCRECAHSHVSLMRAARDHVETCECFAGLKEAAVPVRFGEKTVALLRTGQVLHRKPEAADFDALVGDLVKEGYDNDEINRLRTAYKETKVMSEDHFKQTITLLAIFSLQLSNLINQLVLARNKDEPPVISKAKQFIRENLSERLSLDGIAKAVGVSSFYFCKLFKQSTAMTFTEYVNRQRVECAKHALLRPSARVTEIAFAVGYQSLSQFNRSFLKFAGESPTEYRNRMQASSKRGMEILAS